MEICIKNKALEDAFRECAEAYCERYPEEYEALLKLIREEEACLVKPTGFSGDGYMLTLGKMPQHLYSAIKRVCRKHLNIDDVWRDPENLRLFYRIWGSLKIRKRPTPRLFISSK